MPDITMPKMGFDMQEGTIVRWLKKVGDTIKKGEPIAEIETDKVTIEIEAFASGTITAILVKEGEVAPVNSPIAQLDGPAAGAAPSAPAEGTVEAAGTQTKEAAPAADGVAAPDVEARAESAEEVSAANGDIKASPLARRIAQEKGIDLRQVKGSGPGGRIVREDVEGYSGPTAAAATPATPVAQPAAAAAPAPAIAEEAAPSARPAAAPAAPLSETDTVIPLTNMRKTIARRLGQSWSGIPHIYVTLDVDMGAALEFRQQANADRPKEQQFSVNDLVVKASAIALRSFPNLNASYTDDGIVQHGAINVAIAVSLESGLITPVVTNADQRSLGSLAREAKRLVAAAREGKLSPNDMQGGTFTVSNMGMYGILEFTSIINPPQAAILSVGATQRIPVFRDDSDEVSARHSMHLTIGADHRATDGAEAARFLLEVKRLLENPMQLLVG